MKTIGTLFTGIIMIVIDFIINGFFLMKFWLWFIVPAFPVKELTFPIAIGLAFFIGVVIKTTKLDDDETTFVELLEKWFRKLIYVCLIFGVGYLLYLFIR